MLREFSAISDVEAFNVRLACVDQVWTPVWGYFRIAESGICLPIGQRL